MKKNEFYPTLTLKKWGNARPYTKSRKKSEEKRCNNRKIVHYDTSAMKRFLTSVSLQHEPKASDVITLVKKMFFRTSIVRNFISRGVKMRISAREVCVKPHLRTRSDIKNLTWAPVIVWKRKKPSPFRSSEECSHKMEIKYSDKSTLVQRQPYPLPSRSLQYWPMNHCVWNTTTRRLVFDNIFDNCFVIIGNGEFNHYHFNNCTFNFKEPQ